MDIRINQSVQRVRAPRKGRKKWKGPITPGYCWVYVICWQRRGPCKIGVSDRPFKRKDNLQIGNPYRLKVYAAFGFMSPVDAFAVETAALNEMRGAKLCGEWVDAPAEAVANVIVGRSSFRGLTPKIWNRGAEKPEFKARELAEQKRQARVGRYTKHHMKT